jgi:hypothetical protein
MDKLRLSPTYRDRQIYLIISKSVLKQNREIFKKHFAKAIGMELLNEKIPIV